VIPAANPSAWHHSCAGTNQGEKVPHVWRDSDPSHWCCPHGCVSFQSPGSSALWGHEWAVVAWMAAAEHEGWFSLVSEGIPATRESWRETVSETATGKRLIDWGRT